jgi:F-type H+-transporting ATPase subunit delta
MAAVLDKAGIKGLTANFVGLVAQNRRLFVLPDMIRAYNALLARHRGEVGAEVTSAQPLGDAQIKALKAVFKSSIGRDVNLTARVDESLLGGLVVKVGSRMVDTSLKTKLDNLQIAMKEVG